MRTMDQGLGSFSDRVDVERWRRRHGVQAVPHGLWDARHLSGTDFESIRDHNVYVFQDRVADGAVERSYRELERRYPDLMALLSEPGDFGVRTWWINERLVSRDHLDSVAEIGYLTTHFALEAGPAVLDIGAGYGRLAHRFQTSNPEVLVVCADVVPESSAVCEAYLAFRCVPAEIITQGEARSLLSEWLPELAVAVHSFPEMSPSSIATWLEILESARVEFLFIVPNEIGDLRAAGLGLELLRETQRVVALLCDLPDVGEPLDERFRRFPLRRFPFGVVYRQDGSLLRIIAFAHRRRRPRYWPKRK